MTIESELLRTTDETSQEDVGRVAYYFGFDKEPWPTLRQTGEALGVSHQTISDSVNSHLERINETSGLPALNSCREEMETRGYWLASELRERILELGLAGNRFRIEGFLRLLEHLADRQIGPPCKYKMYLPEPKGQSLKKRPRPGKSSDREYFVVLNSLAERAGEVLREARDYPNTFGLAKLSDLMHSSEMKGLDDGSSEFGRIKELVGVLVRSSGKYWHCDFGGETWYVARRAASSDKMPQSRVRTYSEKVFSEVKSCPVGKLAISYCRALSDRSQKRFHVPVDVMEQFLRGSDHFEVVDERVKYRGQTGKYSELEEKAVMFLKETLECEATTLREHLLGIYPERGSAIDKVIYYSPLVFVETTQSGWGYLFSWIGWEDKGWEAQKRRSKWEEAQEKEWQKLRLRLEGLDETDGRSEKKGRLEQHLLRRFLFGRQRRASCAMCGKEFPVEALWVAHKKKRRVCSDEERKDLNIVMPLCVFGCDFLYEQRYVRIIAGKVARGKSLVDGEYLRKYVDSLKGKELADRWLQGAEDYFAFGW
ncbi:MAG: hypothetical protein OXC99_03640 [Chloroflexi bacterium]|nr:hypothetical protein [Chloroflexota bacterium]